MIVESSWICRGLHFFRYEVEKVASTAGFEDRRTNMDHCVSSGFNLSRWVTDPGDGPWAHIYGETGLAKPILRSPPLVDHLHNAPFFHPDASVTVRSWTEVSVRNNNENFGFVCDF